MNITTWFVFSIILLMIFALMSNVSAVGRDAIITQTAIIACPFPIQEGVFNATSGEIDHDREIDFNTGFLTGGTTNDTAHKAGSFFVCFTETNAGQQVPATTIEPRPYGQVCGYVIPCGWFHWVADSILIATQKFSAMFVLIGYFLTPINFNILGFTISDIGGVGLLLVLSIYAFAYLGIGLFIYNAIRRGIT